MVGTNILFCGMYIDEITGLVDFNKLEKYSLLKICYYHIFTTGTLFHISAPHAVSTSLLQRYSITFCCLKEKIF